MTSPLTTPTTEGRWTPRLWGTLLVLCAAMFLDALDVSMVGVALPSIGSELDLSTSTLQWIVSGYILGYGGLLLLGGRTADLLGRRQVFLVALGVFALASLLGGLVDSGPLLIASRFIKGLSAAFTAPAGLSIITTTFAEGPAQSRPVHLHDLRGHRLLDGPRTVRPAHRGQLAPHHAAARAHRAARPARRPEAAAAQRTREGPQRLRHPRRRPRHGLDAAAGVHRRPGPEVGWASTRTLLSFLAVAVLLTVFVRVERRSAGPLIRLGVLRSGSQIRAQLGAMAFFGSYVGFQFLVTLYMQSLLGWSALHTALAFLPAGALVALSSTKVGAVVDRFGTPRLIAVGFVLMVVGYALFLRISLDPGYAAVILPTMLLIGAACALIFPSLNIQATNGVDDHEQGMVSGLLNTSVQVGGALFLAVVTAVVTANSSAGSPRRPSSTATGPV